jgi:hypothetical protein
MMSNSEFIDEAGRDERVLQFQRISELLLDWRPLPLNAARAYFEIILAVTPRYYAPGDIYEPQNIEHAEDPHPFDVLWTLFQELEQESIAALEDRFCAITTADVTLNTLVQNIITVWYNGFIGSYLPPAEIYAAALVWQVIQANPPGIPGPYYGHWAYPPAEPIQPPISQDK